MTISLKRAFLRYIHLILSIPILGYIYEPAAQVQQYAGATRYAFVPIVVFAGYWMFSGVIFAAIGVALWIAAYYFFGYGALILSQAALLVARKIWLVARARHSATRG